MLLTDDRPNLAAKLPPSNPALGFSLSFADLYDRDGLVRLDAAFVTFLHSSDPELHERLRTARADPERLAAKEESSLLIELGPFLEDFLGELFGIADEVGALAAKHHELAPLYAVKRLFVQRKASNKYKADVAATFDGDALRAELAKRMSGPFSELAFANAVQDWQKDEAANADVLDIALQYAAWAAHTEAGQAAHATGVLFKAPKKLDPARLVPLTTRSGMA
jgi:hypothetical protein